LSTNGGMTNNERLELKMLVACMCNSLQCAKDCVEASTPVNFFNNIPLSIAVHNKNFKVVKYLISQGAQLEINALHITTGNITSFAGLLENIKKAKKKDFNDIILLFFRNKDYKSIKYIVDYIRGEKND